MNGSAYAHYFGRTYLGEIRGVSYVTGVMGAACGPLPFALQNPQPGAYNLVLMLSATACALVAIASFRVPKPIARTQ
jgi:hypothetical protein